MKDVEKPVRYKSQRNKQQNTQINLMKQKSQQLTFQNCVSFLEYVINETNLGITQLNPNCQKLIVVINPSGESVNLNHLSGYDPKAYFVTLNNTTQIYNPPFVTNARYDLIRHYLFNNIARKCPNIQIQLVFMINSDSLQYLKEHLKQDFGKIPNPEGIVFLLYNTTNEKNIQMYLEQLYKHDGSDIVSSYLSDIQNQSRIIPISNQDFQDKQFIQNLIFTVPGQYTVQEMKNLFYVNPECSGKLKQCQEVFQGVSDSRIRNVFKDVTETCSKASIQKLLKILPGLIEFEITLKTLHFGNDYNDMLIDAFDKVYQCLDIEQTKQGTKEFSKYLELLQFFSVEDIGKLLQVSFQKSQFIQEFINIINKSIQYQEIELNIEKVELQAQIKSLQQQQQLSNNELQQVNYQLIQLQQQLLKVQNSYLPKSPDSSYISQKQQTLPQQISQNQQQQEFPLQQQPIKIQQQQGLNEQNAQCLNRQEQSQLQQAQNIYQQRVLNEENDYYLQKKVQPLPQQPQPQTIYQQQDINEYCQQTEQPQEQIQTIFKEQGLPQINLQIQYPLRTEQSQQYYKTNQESDETKAQLSQIKEQNQSKSPYEQLSTQLKNDYEEQARKKVKEN